MNDVPTGSGLESNRDTDWEQLRCMSDAAIHAAIEADPDAMPTDEGFWKSAAVVLPRRKEVVTMRLDADVLEWFRKDRGYQTRINAILQAYMKAHSSQHNRVIKERCADI